MLEKEIIGSWKANRDGRITANAYALCSDILTLDPDGRVLRQFDTTKVVERTDGAKEHYHIVVTLVGSYTLDGDVITFKDMNPRFESSEYFMTTEGCLPEVMLKLKSRLVKEAGEAALEGVVAEVMMNKAQECEQGNSGKIPPCHVRVEDNQFIMKWEGYDGEDKMQKCDEPANLSRTKEATPVEVALRAQADSFKKAIGNGDCMFLNNATLLMPCEIEREGNSVSIKIDPLNAGGMRLIVVYTDRVVMSQSELRQARMNTKFVKMAELNSLMGPFDGICVNPVQGKSLCLKQHMVDAIVNEKWGGIGPDGKIIINE